MRRVILYLGIVGFLSAVFVYKSIPLFLKYVTSDEVYGAVFLVILTGVVLCVVSYSLYAASEVNNKELLERIRCEKKIRISHRLSETRLKEKLRCGFLIPYPPVKSRLPKWFVHWQDGSAPATWVSLGRPREVITIFLGKIFQGDWTMAISFEVESAEITMPPTIVKKLFGVSQQRIMNAVTIPNDVEIYKRSKKGWVLLEGRSRADFLELIGTSELMHDAQLEGVE